MSGRNPPSYCTLAMQGHQQKGRQTNTTSNNKDKSNTIIETSTAEDHDDENLHNPSTRPRYSPGSCYCCCCCLHIKNRSDLYPERTLLFLTLQGKETNFGDHKLTQNKVQKNNEKSKKKKKTQRKSQHLRQNMIHAGS